MDTPPSNQESSVFNYISNLSPIQPVKSQHTVQTFNSSTHASLPSVYTSSHASSLKESRFLQRHQQSDQSKLESKFSTKEGLVMDTAQMYDDTAELQETFDAGVSFGVPTEHSHFSIELPQGLKYDCGSPDCGPTACSNETKFVSELAGISASGVQKTFGKAPSESEVHLQNICQIEPKKKEMTCDWEDLIFDDADLLIFEDEAIKGIMPEPVDPETIFGTSVTSHNDNNNLQNMLLINNEPSGGQHHKDISSFQPGESSEHQTQARASTNLNEFIASNRNENMNDKADFNLHQGIRRRCLDFEMVGSHRMNLHNVSNRSSSILSQSDERTASKIKKLVPINTGVVSSRYKLPGIGLHLNALGTTSKDYRGLKDEILSAGKQIMNFPCLPSNISDFLSPPDNKQPFHNSVTSASFVRETDSVQSRVQLAVDASQSSSQVTEEYNQNTANKKRKRLEHAEESESCKRCNCKKSKCLKLYCECFAAGVYCIETCSCQDCFNKPIYEDTVLETRKQIESRNTLAFGPKVINSTDSNPEIVEESTNIPTLSRHKRGCNCKKSSCQKKYCECYQSGVGCSINCRCEGCRNKFGRKDGTEAEQEEVADTSGKNVVNKEMLKTEIQRTEVNNSASALVTPPPLQFFRPSIYLPFQSASMQPQPSFPAIEPAFGLYRSQIMGRPNNLQSQSKFENELFQIFRGNSSAATSIKTASPNSKRISPPENNSGPSSGQSSGRKLILKSIPSIPSLNPHS